MQSSVRGCKSNARPTEVDSTRFEETPDVVDSTLGCWDGVGLPLRAPSPGSAVREERACQRTCSCEIWISERSTTSMVVVWKLWQTDCRCLAGLSWQQTRLWFPFCVETAQRPEVLPIATARPFRQHIDGRRGRTRNLSGREVVPGWSHLQAKLVAGVIANFLRVLAVAKARDATNVMQASVELAWFRRWSSILSCAAARAFADSLLEVRVAGGAGGDALSSNDVVWDNRF